VTLLVLAGVLSMLAQVVILRELVSALFGVELLYVLALGTWLVGTAAGSWAAARAAARPRVLAAGFLALGVFVPAGLVLVRAAGRILGAMPGAYLPFPAQVLLIGAATLPAAAACGALFPPLAAAGGRRSRSVGRAYAIESAGAAAGGALVTAAMWLGVPTFAVAMVAAALAFAAAAIAVMRRPAAAAALAAIAAAGAVALPRAGPWDARLARWTHPALVDAADTPYARVVVTSAHGQVAVFENGALAFESEGTSAEAFADIAAAQHASPRRALVVGGGAEGVAAALAADQRLAVDDVETDARAYRLVRAHVPGPLGRSGPVAAAHRVIFAEPRVHLARGGAYDLILIAAGEPASGAASRFYTREFFRTCAGSLAPGGVLALRLAASENVWPWPLARRTASIVNALRREFPHVDVLPGATLYLFASAAPLASDPGTLSRRLADRGVQPRQMTPPYVRYLYDNDRRSQVRRLLASLHLVAPNRDAAPACYQYAAALWLARFCPALAAASPPGGRPIRWAVAAGAAVVLGGVVWARRRPRGRLVLLLAGAGFAGMVLETVLLLQYQVANGTVYQAVGWLLTCFMGGLAAGSWAVPRPRGGKPGEALPWTPRAPATALLASAVVAGLSTRVPAMAGLAWTSLMLAGTGAAVGACFAAAAAHWPGERLGGASSLYAADVAGGAAGAVLVTLFLVPAVGIDGAALVTGLLAAALLLL